jgi:hypothetical protein
MMKREFLKPSDKQEFPKDRQDFAEWFFDKQLGTYSERLEKTKRYIAKYDDHVKEQRNGWRDSGNDGE